MATNTCTHGVPPLISGTGYSTDLKYKVMPTKQTPPKKSFEKNRNRISLFTLDLEMFRSIGALLALRNLHLQALLLFPLARQLNSAMQAIGEETKIRLEI